MLPLNLPYTKVFPLHSKQIINKSDMNIDLYKRKTEEVINKTSIERKHLFEYDLSPYNEEFDDVFGFYQENLDLNAKYGIIPSIIFFNNNRTINAKAGKVDGYYIISMNMGLIVGLITMFENKVDLLKEEINKDFIDFEKILDSTIHHLMYQNAVHFTFYHEMAHLIQKSELLEYNLYEHLDNSQGFSERRHLLELDADEFSSISIGVHILDYVEKTFGKEFKSQQLEKLLIVACSSILIYLLNFKSYVRKIYFEEMSHPHPIIRIMWITFSIIGYCTRTLEAKGIKTNLTTKDVYNKTLDFSESVSDHFFDNNPITEYKESIREAVLEMMSYMGKYQNLKNEDETLAVNKWNQLFRESQKK
jgi:hypothetical protein